MPLVKRSLHVPYTAAEMYKLVDDIAKYPEFLTWCKKTIIYSRTAEEVRANLTLSKGGFNQSFSTLNRLQKNKMIEVHLIEGPFHHLQGYWLFESLEDNTCKVFFDLEFEFSSRILAFTVGPVLERIAESIVETFYNRAKYIYGERGKSKQLQDNADKR